MSKKRVMKKIGKWAGIVIGSLVLLLAVIFAAIVWILSPSRLTPIVQDYANEYLINSDTKIGSVELTIWKTFPCVALDVDNLTIVSHSLDAVPDSCRAALPANCDSLLQFDKFHLELNLLRLATATIDIRDVMLSGLRANVVMASAELSNFDIVPPSDSSDDTSTSLPDITINSVEISNCRGISYLSLADSISADVDIIAAQLSAQKDNRLQLIFDSFVSATYAADTLASRLPVMVNTMLDWNADDAFRVGIADTKAKIGNIPISLDMDVNFAEPLKVDKLNSTLGEFDFLGLLPYIPKEYADMFNGFDTNLRSTIGITLTEPYVMASADDIPSLRIDVNIPDSYLTGPKRHRINRIAASAKADINGKELDKSTLAVSNVRFEGEAVKLKGSADVSTPLSDPHLKAAISGNANLPNLIRMLGIDLPYAITGRMNADTNLDIHINDIAHQRYNNLGINGKVELKNFTVNSPADTIELFTDYARLTLGSNQKFVSQETGKSHNLMSARFTIDTVFMNYKGMNVSLGELQATAAAGKKMKKLQNGKPFVPFGARITAKSLRYLDIDSTRAALRDVEGRASITASAESNVPEIRMLIHTARARYGGGGMYAGATNAEIGFDLMPRLRQQRRFTHADSLHRDSLRAIMRQTVDDGRENIDMSVDSTTKALLRNWQLSGIVRTDSARLVTPYFPLRNKLSNVDIAFSLDSLIVNTARLTTGRSSFDITGGIRNIRSTMMGRNRRPLDIGFSIISDTLDINQLISTAYAGMAYADSHADVVDSAMDIEEMENNVVDQVTDTVPAAFVIPSNIEADIDIYAKNGMYADMKLQNVSGCLQVHDGALRLNDIQAMSDMGSMTLEALYAAQSKQKIRCAFEIGMQKVQLDRFIDLIPGVDSIMPLLNSMDGIIDAEIAASSDVDSAMNVIFPTLTAAVKLHGDSLVLFDSETFATISKWLMFKNKKRNLIDNMDVELVVKDNTLELFPFIFQMDRYKVGVMGSNDLDLNLNYHVSVLKSPIPFKFGLNISGNADKMKFRLGRARFKEGMAGSKTSIANNARLNLRDQISKAFKRGANAAMQSNVAVDTLNSNIMQGLEADTLSHEDSLKMIEQGLIEAPVKLTPEQIKQQQKEEKKRKKQEEKQRKEAAKRKKEAATKNED